MAKIGFLEKSLIPGIKKMVLENGIVVFLEELLERRKVVFSVGIGVGSRDETGELQGENSLLTAIDSHKLHGISHFVEHIQFHSNRFRTADEITENAEYGGAKIGAGTDFDSTAFYVKGYPRYLSQNIRIIYEAITNFDYKDEEIERERQEILTELRKYIDSPGVHYLDNLFVPALLRKTWAERPVPGIPKTIKNITKEELIAFKKKFYAPENMAIFVCGKFDAECITKAIEKTFGRLKPRSFKPKTKIIDLKNRRKEIFRKRSGLELAYMAMGYKVFGFNHSDALKLMILASVLSAGMSSRLYKKLRGELGIGYDELDGVYDDYGGIGAFYITVGGFDPGRFKKTKSFVLKELEDLKTNLVSKEEFIKAKNMFLSENDDELDDLEKRSQLLSDFYFRKSIFDPRNFKKHISKISREALRRTAQKYFSDKYTLTVLAPKNFSDKN